MDYLNELLKQKELIAKSSEDIKKIEIIKSLFLDKSIFFKMKIDTAYGILSFLGVDSDKIDDVYMSLISSDEYMKTAKPYYMGTISK